MLEEVKSRGPEGRLPVRAGRHHHPQYVSCEEGRAGSLGIRATWACRGQLLLPAVDFDRGGAWCNAAPRPVGGKFGEQPGAMSLDRERIHDVRAPLLQRRRWEVGWVGPRGHERRKRLPQGKASGPKFLAVAAPMAHGLDEPAEEGCFAPALGRP
jgi:hypothetical protein